MCLWHPFGVDRDEMAEGFTSHPALAVSMEESAPIPIPARFRETVDRHQNNLIALSAALRTAGVTAEQAAECIDVALASFREGLANAVAKVEDPKNACL